MAKFIRVMFYSILSIFGGLLGYQIGKVLQQNYATFSSPINLISLVLLGILLGAAIAPLAATLFLRLMDSIISAMKKFSLQEIIMGSIGLIFGLLIATFINLALGFIPFQNIEIIGEFIKPLLYLLMIIFWGYLGVFLTTRMAFVNSFNFLFKGKTDEQCEEKEKIKILDTSIIVDGRIYEITKTGFIEGRLIVPQFVLNELQLIADSADVLKRNRGRRGLDVLNNLRKKPGIEIVDKDYDENGVDAKLIKLTRELEGQLLTTDYNLNKVAQLQGLTVLNINELANAMKPIVLPGEELFIEIIKDGKEPGQGVGYLDDGTMVVAEGGKKHKGKQISVEVTSLIQTVAGKMIFGRVRKTNLKNGE
ncbi:MAG: PIN/TRAM domain-containing protein [Vulcanimicrobiota bacterium]